VAEAHASRTAYGTWLARAELIEVPGPGGTPRRARSHSAERPS
jgi:hypothetical protein